MKRIVLLHALALLGATALPAQAACDLTGYIVSPDLMTYSLPGLGMAAFENVPDNCALVMPVKGVGRDTISLFAASYSGQLTEGTGGRLTVSHNGAVDQTSLVGEAGNTFGELATGTVFAHGSDLASGLAIEVTNAVSGDEFDLDTVDYVLMSRADLFDLSLARAGMVTQLNGTAALLLGGGEAPDEADGLSLLGGVGSVTLGLSGHANVGDGFSVRGGLGYLSQASTGSTASGVLASGAVRYTGEAQTYRPYFEVGALAAPHLAASFGLNYATQTSTLTAMANTSASYYGGYVESGVLLAPTPGDSVVLSANATVSVLGTEVFTENPGDPSSFAIIQPNQTGLFNAMRLRAEWTRQFTPQLATTLTGAIGHTFGTGTVRSEVPGAGTFDTAAAGENFAEYGARLTYSATSSMRISAFLFGTAGEVSGNHAQVGGTLRVSF